MCNFESTSISVLCVLGSVHGGPGAEAAARQADLRSLQPASSGPPGTSPRQRDAAASTGAANETRSDSFSPSKSSHCLPLSSAEAREEEGGGAEEEGVGGRAAREDAEQITILQRGQALSLSPLRLRPLLMKPLQAAASLSRSPLN